MRAHHVLGLTLALVACSPASPPPAPVAPPPLPPPSATSSTPLPTVSAAAPVAPPASLFFPALVSRDALTLYRLDNAVIARREFDGQQLAVAEGDDFVLHPELSKGFPERGASYSPTSLFGHFPDAMWMVLRISDYSHQLNTASDVVYRFKDGSWQAVDRPPVNQFYVGLWEAPRGCLLGLLAPTGMADSGFFASNVRVRVVDCKGQTPALPGILKGPDKGRGRRIYAAEGAQTGELYLLDQEDELHPKKPPPPTPVLLETWPRGSAAPSTVPLSMPPELASLAATYTSADRALLVRAANDVYVAMNVVKNPSAADPAAASAAPAVPPWIARFDGASWTPIERPPVVAYSEIVLANDGAFLLRSNKGPDRHKEADELWRKRPGEPWSSLGALPAAPPCLPTQITGRSGDDVWVLCWAGSKGSVLYHTRRPAKILDL